MRKCRILKTGARYHVCARVNNREQLLDSENAKKLFEEILERAKTKFSFSIENFVIMGNHYHLIIRPLNGENLSKIMQWIMSVYAMTFNHRNGRTGHFWGSRFFSWVLDSLQQFLKTFEYIDQNPIKAHLTKNLNDWQFGGLAHHRAGKYHIVDLLPDFLLVFCITHTQLLLPRP
jgi:putative transposase